MVYGYFVWVLILALAWVVVFIFKKGLKKKILISSLIAFPFGFGDLYYIPNYWTPETFFNFGIKYHFAIESFLLMFFLGGTAAFVYEIAFKKNHPVKEKICGKFCKCNWSFLIALASFVVLIKLLPNLNIIYPTSLALLIGGLVGIIVYPNLRKHIIFGGILYALFYWISLALANIIVGGWIFQTWNFSALSGITLLKVPIEEIMFGFTFGLVWTPLYEEICHKRKM